MRLSSVGGEHSRATAFELSQHLALVVVGCGNFLYPAYFRSFPSVASSQAGAGCSVGPGAEVGPKPALTRPGTRFGRFRPGVGDRGRDECWRKLRSEIFMLRSFPLKSAILGLPGLPGPVARERLGPGTGGLKPALSWLGHGLVAGGPVGGGGGQGRVLAEVEAGNFCAPLISAQIRHFGVAGPAGPWAAERLGAGCAGCSWHCQTWNVASLSGCP